MDLERLDTYPKQIAKSHCYPCLMLQMTKSTLVLLEWQVLLRNPFLRNDQNL